MENETPVTKNYHYYGVDFLRFIFAICIMGVHTDLAGFQFLLIPCGHLGVDFFFMISGFFLAKDAFGCDNILDSNNGVIAYYYKRIKSFFPYYFLSVVFDIIIYIANQKTSLSSVFYLCVNELFELFPFQVAGFSSYYIVGTQWFVGTLFVVLPFSFLLIQKYGKVFTTIFSPIISVFLFGCIFRNCGNLFSPGYWIGGVVFCGLLRGFADVFLGTSLFSMSFIIREKLNSNMQKTVLLFLEIAFLTGGLTICLFANNHNYDFVFVLFLFFFLLCYFSNKTNMKSHDVIWIRKVSKWLSDISSVIFLIHIQTGIAVNTFFVSCNEANRLLLYYFLSIIFSLLILFICKKMKVLFGNIFS